MNIKTWFDQLKFKYSPTIPSIDYNSFESRRNWILFMAKRTGRYPVREIYNTMEGRISKMSINNDLKALEDEKLIKRERDNTNKSFVIPLFEDSGEAPLNDQEKRRQTMLNIGLPSLCLSLLVILIIIHATGL